MIRCIEKSGQILVDHLPKKIKKNCRGKGFQYHFGHWKKRSMLLLMYETADSRNFWFKYFLSTTQYIWEYIASCIEQDFKDEYDWYMTRCLELNLPYTFGIWECLAINYLFKSEKHRDWKDIKNGICVIIPTGNFTGGNLFLEDFNTIIQLKRKDFFALKSYEWFHENEEFFGNRSSFILFTSM